MKKQHLTTLKLNKKVISNIRGGVEKANSLLSCVIYCPTTTVVKTKNQVCSNNVTCAGDNCNSYQCSAPS